MHPWLSKWVGVAALLMALAPSAEARAEYVENQAGRGMAAFTLGIAGSLSLGMDIANVVYLAGGSGDQLGRIITGVGSLAGGTGLVVGSAMALSIIGEGAIPGGPDNVDSEEARALRQAELLGGLNIGLAVVSIGIGIAALATYDSDVSDAATETSSWQLLPICLASEGAGLGLVATF